MCYHTQCFISPKPSTCSINVCTLPNQTPRVKGCLSLLADNLSVLERNMNCQFQI